MERKVMGNNSRPQKEQALNCPRCQSTNTKFCYYNNYSLTQPRYFCKTCRRYWTEGGTLRNVPVGGGSRKNKLIRSSSSCSSTTNKSNNIIPAVAADHHHHHHQEFSSHQNAYNYYKILHESSAGQDLNLGFPTTTITPPFAALEILKSTGGGGADLNNSFIIPPPPPTTTTTTPPAGRGGGGGGWFSFHDLKPTSSSSTTVSSYMSRYGGGGASGDNEMMMINQENSGRLMFPLFGAMKQVSGGGVTTTHEADADQNSNYGYNWDGMMLGTKSSGASW